MSWELRASTISIGRVEFRTASAIIRASIAISSSLSFSYVCEQLKTSFEAADAPGTLASFRIKIRSFRYAHTTCRQNDHTSRARSRTQVRQRNHNDPGRSEAFSFMSTTCQLTRILIMEASRRYITGMDAGLPLFIVTDLANRLQGVSFDGMKAQYLRPMIAPGIGIAAPLRRETPVLVF